MQFSSMYSTRHTVKTIIHEMQLQKYMPEYSFTWTRRPQQAILKNSTRVEAAGGLVINEK